METRVKRPEEDRVYDFDFSLFEEFIGGETILSSYVYQIAKRPSTASDLTIQQSAPFGSLVQARIQDGQAGASYLLKARLMTFTGTVIVDYGRLLVEEITK